MRNHPYRISEAAVGRMYAELIRMTRSSEITTEQFHDTMFAAFIYIENEKEPDTQAKVNPLVWQHLKAEIDKSARRSAAARAGAAKRKEKKHSLISGAAKSVTEISGTARPSSEIKVNHRPANTDTAGTVTMPAGAADTGHLDPILAPNPSSLQILQYLTPENQREFLRMEQEKFEYAKEQEQKRKEEAAEQERKRIEDEKIAERKRKEELERKREEMDAFVSWQLAGRPPTNRRFNIF